MLLAIHGWSTPGLDVVFLVSHELAGYRFCITLVAAAALVCWHIGERREMGLWLGLGLSTLVLQGGLKVAIGRERPELWAGPLQLDTFSMPSGHAVAAATLYLLIARGVSRLWPARSRWCYGAAVGLALYVGFGRIYLGVHWPSDVLVGWALGALQLAVAVRICDRNTLATDGTAQVG